MVLIPHTDLRANPGITLTPNLLTELACAHVSRRRGSGCAVLAVAHEMAWIMYLMLSRDESYRGVDVGLVETKLKGKSRKLLDGLRN